jgi:Zn-dependent protease
MIKPAFVRPGEEVTVISHFFETPLVIKGCTWLPLAQLFTWPVMAWVAKRRLPERSWSQAMAVGALTMPVVLGSEWGHNLAHTAAAWWVGKPVDAIRIVWGMPLLVYYDINAQDVQPKEHIARALGGPVFNALLATLAYLFWRKTAPPTQARDIVGAALATNIFLPTVGLLPIPFIDGGPILKWSLVERGRSIPEADQVVRKVNIGLGLILSLTGLLAIKKRRRLAGGFLLSLAGWALVFGLGLMKEQAEP